MLPEFGQSPKCLDLDLDSYEESWTHVAAFRGQSGWLRVARATIQSEHDLLRATLVAACDENETPIPTWRAIHLTQCRWDRLDHCYEEPPEILDDLLCEEEGAFYARWQREMNTGLATLYDRAQRNIETLEARATARTREVDLQIADLRRRRRMAGATDEARAMFTEIIAELEAEHDQATAQLARHRAALRRQADETEEALWRRIDVLIEVEPVCLVRWRARSNHRPVYMLEPEQPGSGGISLLRVQRAELSVWARRRAKEAREQARQAAIARAEALARQAVNDKAKKPKRAPDAKPQIVDLPKASPALQKLAAAASQPAPVVNVPTPIPPPLATKGSPPSMQGKLVIERAMLAEMLDKLEERGQKFFSGSPKYRRNVEERADLARRITELDAKASEDAMPLFADASPAIPARPVIPLTDDQMNAWPVDRVEMLRQLWSQGMSAADIGRAIGGVSRNAVIGKAKRLGLPMRAQGDVLARQSPPNGLTAD